MTNVFSNPTISALIGAVVGGVIGFLSGLGSGMLVNRRQRRDTHRSAVRAVLYELSENIPKVIDPISRSGLSTRTYDDLIVPLFTDLPDDIAQRVAKAYAMLHATGPGMAMLVPERQQTVQDAVIAAQVALRTYSENTLRIWGLPTVRPDLDAKLR